MRLAQLLVCAFPQDKIGRGAVYTSVVIGNSGFGSINVNGERWFPSERSFAKSMGDYWGGRYCDSECGELKAVLMHRPPGA